MVLDNSILEIYSKKLHLAILLRSMMPTSGISKFLYDIWCLNRALGNSTISMSEIFAFENSTKKYDTNKWC